jgi:LmbE family N-acetylglucosaminyl deacetylase
VVPVAADEAGQAGPPDLAPGRGLLCLPSGPLSAQLAPQLAAPARQPEAALPVTGYTGLPGNRTLPAAAMVLAVIAHPGQESAELGVVLSAFRLRGAGLAVLCLTRGEESEINSTCERLEVIRPWELQVAAGVLGVSSVTIADYPDGRLSCIPPASLADHILLTVRRTGADLLLVADPAAAAAPDVVAVARAACLAVRHNALAVLARTLPGPGERWPIRLGEDGPAARMRQRHAIDAHSSQCSRLTGRTGAPDAGAGPGEPGAPADHDAQEVSELVRWLVPPAPASPAG